MDDICLGCAVPLAPSYTSTEGFCGHCCPPPMVEDKPSLLPCPFCGETNLGVNRRDRIVACRTCGADQTIDFWNTRTLASPTVSVGVEELRRQAFEEAASLLEKMNTNNVGMLHPVAREQAKRIRDLAALSDTPSSALILEEEPEGGRLPLRGTGLSSASPIEPAGQTSMGIPIHPGNGSLAPESTGAGDDA